MLCKAVHLIHFGLDTLKRELQPAGGAVPVGVQPSGCPWIRHTGGHDTANAGPRTVPVRSGLSGVKTLEFSGPPRPSDVLRAGTARAPVASPWSAIGLTF